MRAFDNGCFYSVQVSAREVWDFKRRWPCSGLPDCGVTFQFDKGNGDLVDIAPEGFDGDAAVALSQDAQAYGRKRLGLDKPEPATFAPGWDGTPQTGSRQ